MVQAQVRQPDIYQLVSRALESSLNYIEELEARLAAETNEAELIAQLRQQVGELQQQLTASQNKYAALEQVYQGDEDKLKQFLSLTDLATRLQAKAGTVNPTPVTAPDPTPSTVPTAESTSSTDSSAVPASPVTEPEPMIVADHGPDATSAPLPPGVVN
jgi:hypothetical protein